MITPQKPVHCFVQLVRAVGLGVWLTIAAQSAEESIRNYDLGAGDAATALRQFSEESGREILFAAEIVRGVRTSPVQGEFTAQAALNRMLAGTSLHALEDPLTGAFAVRKMSDQTSANSSPASNPAPSIQSVEPPKIMKTKNPIALLIAWLGLAVVSAHPTHGADGSAARAAAPQTGSIAGQVSNAATKSYLEGAVVAISGTNRTIITDREGRYQFREVEANEVTVEVSFSGLDTQRIPVPVRAGQRVVRDVQLTSEIYKMDKFTVAGEREGTALAETLQRQAPNVKAVVSSDTYGDLTAAGNIADLLTHLPGITANYSGPEARTVNIRGVPPGLSTVTMDGQQVATAGSARLGRGFEFEVASLANIETIEVTKAPTPDMDGAAIGGSVNLVSKSAFDRVAGRLFSYTVGFATQRGYHSRSSRWQQPIKGYGPSMNFSYSDVVGEKKNIGITITGLANSQPVGGAQIINTFERKNDPGPVFSYVVDRNDVGGSTYSRAATGIKLDYRWNEQTTVSVNTAYNYSFGTDENHAHILQTVGLPTTATPAVLATVDANGNRTGGGYINPNYSNGITRVYAHPTLSLSTIGSAAVSKSGETYLISPAVRHRFDGLNIDYSMSYSDAALFYNRARKKRFDSRVKGEVTLQLGGIGWLFDRSRDSIWPTITQTEGPSMFVLSNYSLPSTSFFTQPDRTGLDTVLSGKFDLRKDLSLSVPTFIKAGFIYKQQKRSLFNNSHRYNFVGADGTLGTSDDKTGLAQFLDTRGIIVDDEERYFKNRGGLPQWPDNFAMGEHLTLHPEQWKEDIVYGTQNSKQLSLRTMRELIAAAYVMGNIRLGKVSVLSGVRMEDTRGSGEGPVNYVSPAEKARRAAWVGPVTDPELRRRTEAQFGGRVTNKGQYRDVLPGVHLKYEPFERLVTRASWSTGVGRPDFGSIIPNTIADDTPRTVSVSNPNLKPQHANNYDLTAEYYFNPQGVFSVSLFRKKIADYIYTDTSQTVGAGADNGFDGEYVGYRLTTQANGGTAKIEGIEFNYQQQLSFLPGWAKGFGVYTNYGYTQTEGNYGGTVVLTTRSLAGFLNKNGNAGLSYRGYGLDLRLQAAYRGNYLITNSTTPALLVYSNAKTTWNLKARYDVMKRLTLFLDVENLFEEPLNDRYGLYKDRATFYATFHTKINAGFTGRF